MEPSTFTLTISPDEVAFIYSAETAFQLYHELNTLASSEMPETIFLLNTLATFYGFNVTPS